MSIILRIIGAFWILYTGRPVITLFLRLFNSGLNFTVGLADGLNTIMLVGGFGLLFLKEWGRVVLRVGTIAFFIIQVVQPILQLHFTLSILSPLVYYAVFIILLSLPQARMATRE